MCSTDSTCPGQEASTQIVHTYPIATLLDRSPRLTKSTSPSLSRTPGQLSFFLFCHRSLLCCTVPSLSSHTFFSSDRNCVEHACTTSVSSKFLPSATSLTRKIQPASAQSSPPHATVSTHPLKFPTLATTPALNPHPCPALQNRLHKSHRRNRPCARPTRRESS